MIRDSYKSYVLGILAAIGILLVFGHIPSGISMEMVEKRLGGFFFVWPAVFDFPRTFIAMFVGAYLAKTDFVRAAILLSIILWAGAIYVVNLIAQPMGQHSLADIIAMNSIGLLVGIASAHLGAIAGHRVYLMRHGVSVASSASNGF